MAWNIADFGITSEGLQGATVLAAKGEEPMIIEPSSSFERYLYLIS